MTITSISAHARQEQARLSDGKFGHQHHQEPADELALTMGEPLDIRPAAAAYSLAETQPHGTEVILGPDGVQVTTLAGNSHQLRHNPDADAWSITEDWSQFELTGSDPNEVLARAETTAYLNDHLGQVGTGDSIISRLQVDQVAPDSGWGTDYAVWADVDVAGLEEDDLDITTGYTLAIHPGTGQVLEVTDTESGRPVSDAPQETVDRVGAAVAERAGMINRSDAYTAQAQQMLTGAQSA